jgi:hypothetical protein
MNNPKCLRCGTEMGEGFIMDSTQGAVLAARWVSGTPERSFWTGTKVKGKKSVRLRLIAAQSAATWNPTRGNCFRNTEDLHPRDGRKSRSVQGQIHQHLADRPQGTAIQDCAFAFAWSRSGSPRDPARVNGC